MVLESVPFEPSSNRAKPHASPLRGLPLIRLPENIRRCWLSFVGKTRRVFSSNGARPTNLVRFRPLKSTSVADFCIVRMAILSISRGISVQGMACGYFCYNRLVRLNVGGVGKASSPARLFEPGQNERNAYITDRNPTKRNMCITGWTLARSN